MRVINARNVHQALPLGMHLLSQIGERSPSRAGDVIVAPCPVATVYERPTERVMFHAWRDANPFFHLYESLWMLAGRHDVAPLANYVERMRTFSDDGESFNAAYGSRWRLHEGRDQLVEIAARLRRDPLDRRAVLQIWDASRDLWSERHDPYTGRDAACNLVATFQTRRGRLDMTVHCRSNDILWGCYGANAVHFSMLQEYVASSVGCPVGTYTQVSVNWHAYDAEWERVTRRATLDFSGEEAHLWSSLAAAVASDRYVRGATPFPLVSRQSRVGAWDRECARFVTQDGRAPSDYWTEPFFREVALPLVRAHDLHRDGDAIGAARVVQECVAQDWREACAEWLARRNKVQA